MQEGDIEVVCAEVMRRRRGRDGRGDEGGEAGCLAPLMEGILQSLDALGVGEGSSDEMRGCDGVWWIFVGM
jgi:hypothetical protein